MNPPWKSLITRLRLPGRGAGRCAADSGGRAGKTGRPQAEPGNEQRRWRRGIVLLIVLVVIVALSLSAYTFSGMMLAHRHSALLNGKRVQARSFVESGVETIRYYLMQDVATQEELGGHFNNPLFFQANVVLPDEDLRSRGGFTVLASFYDETGTTSGIRFGLEDESARLNLNVLLEIDQSSAVLAAVPAELLAEAAQSASGDAEELTDTSSLGRTLLMGLPGMTEDVADAILDWMDDDDEPRDYGAELEYYSSLNPPYAPRNGPLQTVEELLLVRGVTPQLLFGLDTNRNGLIDTHEMSSATTGFRQRQPDGRSRHDRQPAIDDGHGGWDSDCGELARLGRLSDAVQCREKRANRRFAADQSQQQ